MVELFFLKEITSHTPGFNKKLQPVWKALGSWKAIPLGKGFNEFELSSLEDM